MRLVDVRIQGRQKTATVYFELRSKLSIGQLVRLAREKDCTLSELELYADSGYGDNLVCGTFTLWAEGRTSLDDILRELSAVEGGNILPDLVISDLNFSGDDAGFDFIAKLHSLYPELKIIVYSMFFFGRNGSDGNSKRRGGLYFKKCAVGRAYRMHGKRF